MARQVTVGFPVPGGVPQQRADLPEGIGRSSRRGIQRVAATAHGAIVLVLDLEVRLPGGVPHHLGLVLVSGAVRDAQVLQALGVPGGFESMDREDAEFMIDLMDTLLD